MVVFEDLHWMDQERTLVDSTLGAARTGHGRAYEAQVLAWLLYNANT